MPQPSNDEDDLKHRLRDICISNGGVSFGVASAEDVEALPRVHVGWTIDTMSKKPSEVLPDVKSVVVFGVESTDDVHELEVHVDDETYEYPGYAPLARIRSRLTEFMKERDHRAVYPYEEGSFTSFKAIARLAGIGAFGKNSLIISPRHGPWLRVGVVYTDAVIEPDGAFEEDLCGDCALCIEACPADALKPYVVDDKLCLVGLSPEERERNDLRPTLDVFEPQLTRRTHVMCTACQVVCPHTSDERRSKAVAMDACRKAGLIRE
ncbi:MAG: epoxyqueuosine reductase [Methanobacteriota archaeon]|nr:MAG: epoxyqueuosine reductase [Euryarchaeota archaeon]